MNNSEAICHGVDRSFGPGVFDPACRGGFDFTVLFEETILSILPSACFLLVAPLQATHVCKGAVRVRPTLLRTVKLAVICAYAGLQLALLVLWSSPSSTYSTPVVIASSTLGLCVALGLGALSPIEHHKSSRPSFLITAYLLISVLFDAARVRTAWLLGGNDRVAGVLSASLAAKLLMLILEAVDKRRFLIQSYRYLSYETTSGLLSRCVFWWLVPLLSDGWKRILSVGDLFSINERLASGKVAEDLQTVWKQEKWQHRGLAASVMWAWRFEVAKILFPRFCLVALSLAQPFLIEKVVMTLSEPEGPQTRNIGYGMVGAVAIVYIGSPVASGFSQHIGFRLMAMMRGGLISIIYRKALQLPSTDSADSPVMTLLGTDVERICEIWHIAIAEIFPNIIQLGVAAWLLYRQMGAVCVAPVILVFVVTAVSLKAASYVTTRQKQWFEAIQARINFTSQILGSMKSVKMLGLTEMFESMIQSLRIRELDFSKRFRRLSSFNICLINVPQHFSQFMTFAAFAIVAQIQGQSSFSVTQAVTSLAILGVLMQPLSLIIYAIPQAYAAFGCFRRIEEFLLSSSWTDSRLYIAEPASGTDFGEQPKLDKETEAIELRQRSKSQSETADTNVIALTNASFGWGDAPPVVKNVNMSVTKDTPLTLILGPVGCGKSTVLKGLLGEASILEGTVQIRTKRISFCDHNPWLVNGSIRENIIGETPYDQGLYDSVIHACTLSTDLEQLPEGDETTVGSKGVTLSGGQKQRIAIARAVYARTHVAIFDDVLTGLDAVTQDTLLERVFGPQGILRKLGTTTILATHAANKVAVADLVLVLDKAGHVVKQGPPDKITIPEDFIHPESSVAQNTIADKQDGVLSTNKEGIGAQGSGSSDRMDQQRQIGDLSVYKFYFSSLGWPSLVIFAGAVVVSSVFDILGYAWITLWSQHNDTGGSSDLGYWLGLYGFFGIIRTSCMVFAIYFMYVVIVPRSGQNLHMSILKAAMRAPMSFISGTTTGSLINRFSQDMNLVDLTLPATLTNVAFHLAGCFGVAALAINAVSYSAAMMPFLFVAVYYLQRFYLRTSRQLRLLDLEAKAPLYSHVLESLDGMASIRAYGWGNSYIVKNLAYLDTAQKPYYLLSCVQQWLALVLGLIVAVFTTFLTILAVILHGKVNAGFFGIALVSMEGFAQSLASLVAFWTKLETSLGAVSRVKTFSEDTPREESIDESVAPPAPWPCYGALEFRNWTAYYTDSPVLQNVNLAIKAGEKIAICGRTGSGKSSFILSILGMVNTSSGQIIIDDIDLSTIPKEVTRKNVTCVTQDPFLFNGSVRQNADPLGESADSQIIAVLEKVEVWSAIRRDGASEVLSPEKALEVTVDDKFLSHGQRQLFCLARALLRKSNVLILDEPTSSVDASTESQIQSIIESDFAKCTVIMVTHKLSGVLKFDKVAVLDNGSLVEYGPPEELLANGNGAFAKLYSTHERGKA